MSVPTNLIVTDLVANPAEMANVDAFGMSNMPPDKAFFEVQILAIGRLAEDKPDARRVYIKLPNDAEMFLWLHNWKDANGQVLPGLTENQISGRKASWLTALMSCGWDEAVLKANAWALNWLITAANGGKKAVVAYWPPDPANGFKYAEAEFITRESYTNAVARSQLPGNVRPSQRGGDKKDAAAGAPAGAAAPATGAPLPGGGLPGALPAQGAPAPVPGAMPGGVPGTLPGGLPPVG